MLPLRSLPAFAALRLEAVVGVAFLAMFAAPASAQIDLTDPATLHTGPGAGATCATGGATTGPCTYLYQDMHVNGLGPSEFDLYQNDNGASVGSLNPVLMIFGVPNNPTNTIGNVTGAQLYNPYPLGIGGSPQNLTVTIGTSAYGLSVPSTGADAGLAGEMTSSDVYSFLNVPGTGIDASNSFTNWAAADAAVMGITAANFSIYVFAVDLTGTAGFGANDLINVDISDMPNGTFVVGYGQNASGTTYVNPFTEAGLIDTPPVTAPEPASLLLLGTSLLGAGVLSRRRRQA
jgi:PEP-CTERM motif